ncbi:unnamed protein product [Psylliodes chrysocephalus]|uniref:Uncharacterized protein n=1 Tax=Psylliodes chrysocephalus TaxID=3402493 RepID=A0A9P0G5R8_9CUCU|nr:unnamed protein product [Psylliodes chrysocephala]
MMFQQQHYLFNQRRLTVNPRLLLPSRIQMPQKNVDPYLENPTSVKDKHTTTTSATNLTISFYAASKALQKTPPLKEIMSPSDILPLPIVVPKNLKKAGKRRRGETAIITSSPYLLELKENLDKPTSKAVKSVKRKLCEDHNAKNRPKKLRKSRKISTDSESSTEEPTNYYQDSDFEESKFLYAKDITTLNKEKENEFTLIHKDIDPENFVLVTLTEITKGK